MTQDASIAPLVALKFLELEEMSRTPPLDPPVSTVRPKGPKTLYNWLHLFGLAASLPSPIPKRPLSGCEHLVDRQLHLVFFPCGARALLGPRHSATNTKEIPSRLN